MPKLYVPEFSYSAHLTHAIKSGDTLESVAEELGIDIYGLRSYHNRFCPLKDAIGPVFPNHLKLLIIKPEKVELSEEEREKNREKVVFNEGLHKLSLNNSHGENKYGVIYTIENGEETHTIKQEIKVQWKAKNDGYYFFEVTRIGNIFINDTAASPMAEEIAKKASSALYPLLVVVNETGEWVYINNFDQIKERWNKVKKQIRIYYKGNSIEKYLSIYDKNLEDSDTLFLSLSKDWFLNAFFNAIHIQYPPNLFVQKQISFPFLAKSENIQYQVEQRLDEYLDVDKFIVIDINGQLDDTRTKTDFAHELNLPVQEYSEEKPTGNYRAKYFLNPNNYLPETLIISCDLLLDVPQKYTVTISNLYNQEELVITSRQEIFIHEIKTQKKDKNQIWILLFILFLLVCLIYGMMKFYSN